MMSPSRDTVREPLEPDAIRGPERLCVFDSALSVADRRSSQGSAASNTGTPPHCYRSPSGGRRGRSPVARQRRLPMKTRFLGLVGAAALAAGLALPRATATAGADAWEHQGNTPAASEGGHGGTGPP